MEDYYKAYDKRYRQVHDKNTLWFSFIPTIEVMDVINEYKIDKNSKILEIGCGEGRDAIFLLNDGYNVIATDCSKEGINKCNDLSKNKYTNNFKQLDVINDKLDEKFDFIYSISVLNTLIDDNHRQKFLRFIKSHLTDNGLAFIVVTGDGEEEYCSNKEDAFIDVEKLNINTEEEMQVANTSCKIVNWQSFLSELKNSDLKVESKWISDRIPDFSISMCVVVK